MAKLMHEVTAMDVDKVIAVVSAAGIELIDRRRNRADNGWSLSFSNGTELDVRDTGKIAASGKGTKTVTGLLSPAAKKAENRKTPSKLGSRKAPSKRRSGKAKR
jgi:hypothetical protein